MANQRTTQPKPTAGRARLRLAAFAAGLLTLASLGLLACIINHQIVLLVTPARNTDIGAPAWLSPAYQNITLTTSDGLRLSGWYIPGTKPGGIILVHGLNANRKAMLPEAAILAEAGYHLLLFDLRGHGQSEGNRLSYGYREALDVQAAADYLASLTSVSHIGTVGVSLGGAAIARAAAMDPRLKAVVIENSYSSLPAAVEDAFDNFTIFPERPFAPLIIALAEQRVGIKMSQVDSARDLAAISPRAVLIIHGLDDGLFPVYHAQRMYDAAQEPKELWLINNLGHANPVIGREAAYKERVVGFFERAFGE